ncbi:MAG: phosphatase PAP2 family protein [bacterium]
MFGIWAGGYFAISHFTEGRPVHTLSPFQWEHRIPFRPEFVWIYLSIYPTFLLPFLFIRDKDFFRIFSLAYITVMSVCYVTYLAYPVTIERPAFAVDSFSTWTLRIVYQADRPWNCFPSMHVAMSLLSALTILEVHRVRGILTLMLTCTIAASTVLIKQHYILDIVAAMGLTLLIYFVYFRRRIVEVLFENFQRIEETLEKWLNRRIDQRVLADFEGPMRTRIVQLVRSVLQEEMSKPGQAKDGPGSSNLQRKSIRPIGAKRS